MPLVFLSGPASAPYKEVILNISVSDERGYLLIGMDLP